MDFCNSVLLIEITHLKTFQVVYLNLSYSFSWNIYFLASKPSCLAVTVRAVFFLLLTAVSFWSESDSQQVIYTAKKIQESVAESENQTKYTVHILNISILNQLYVILNFNYKIQKGLYTVYCRKIDSCYHVAR